jgi:subtilisin-like proprotein convertase family protein
VENITLSGKLTPNTDGLPGTLHGSSLSCSPLSHLFFDLNDGIPGTGTDMVTVTGNVALNHATLHVSVDYPPFEGQRFRIISCVSPNPVSGTFAGLPNGSVLIADGVQFVVLYNGGSDGVELVATNTPLRFRGPFRLSGGNLNARLDPNECNLVGIVVSNAAATPITGVRATLVPRSGGVSVTQPFASYPDLAPGTTDTNRTPFQISLLPGFVCGTVVVCDLLMETDNYGPFRFSIGLGTGLPGSPVRFDHNTGEPIPDFSTLDSTVNVSGINSAIYDVAVSLHITHPSVGELDISLISPAGTVINLSSDNGGSGANYGAGSADNERTTFVDAATNPAIGSGAAPFVGRFRPEVPLTVLRYDHSEEVNGVWILRVADDTGGNVGTLQGWSLFITPAVCSPSGGSCESCPERTILGSISGQSQAQMGRLIRDHHPSACSVAKTCPGTESLATQRRFDAYTFENGESNACITVSLGVNSRDAGELFSAAYLDVFNPANVCQNYLADLGADVRTGQTNSYSFDIAAGARFVIVVSAKEPTSTMSRYRLDVLGGSCRPMLNIRDVISARAALSWSTAAVGYQLERLGALPISSTASWLPVTNNPVVTNGRFCVTNLVAPDSTRFYRLRQP